MTTDHPTAPPDSRATSEATIQVSSPGPKVIRIEVAGEIDITNVADLAAALRQAAHARPERLEVDLSGVTFLGCAGVRPLRAAQRMTPSLVVLDAPDATRRLLSLADLPLSPRR